MTSGSELTIAVGGIFTLLQRALAELSLIRLLPKVQRTTLMLADYSERRAPKVMMSAVPTPYRKTSGVVSSR